METYRSERTFDLKYFLVTLIKNWYWIAGATGAIMIALPVYQFLRQFKNYRKALAAFEAGTKGATEPTFPGFPFTYILFGAILGFVGAVVVIWFIQYYLNHRLKCATELNKPRDAELLAVYNTSVSSKTERFAKKLVRYPQPLPEDRMTKLLCARLVAVSKNQEIQTIVVAGNIGQSEKAIMLKAVEMLQKVGISVEWIGNILSEPEAILRMKAGVGVVLAEQTGKATYGSLDEEVAVCERNRTKILGFAAFE